MESDAPGEPAATAPPSPPGRWRRLLERLASEERSLFTPRLADEGRWYTEHAALLVSTLKWASLGAAAGICVGFGTRAFLWALAAATAGMRELGNASVPAWAALPLALPLCVWLIRTFAPDARGHGTEAVIAAIHTRSGRIDWIVAPVKLVATVVTLAFGGSVGKEGPCAQIGAALTSLFADVLRLSDADRRRLVICGISAGFAAVFGTPISGALFGIEVLYLGQLDYSVIFPALVAGIVAHLACGAQPPIAIMAEGFGALSLWAVVLISLASGAIFGLVALLLIESLRFFERAAKRLEAHPYWLAVLGGALLIVLFGLAGDRYSGLGTTTINGVLAGTMAVSGAAFALKILATSLTLETGGSGGIVTPIFFVGATSGAALAHLFGLPQGMLAAFGFVAVLAAAANTPIAAAVMAIELLPTQIAVYAALAAATAFLMVGHRSVYASQKLGIAKSAGLEVMLGGTLGDFDPASIRAKEGTFAFRLDALGRPRRRADDPKE